jgi:hypothetical protein
LIKRIVPFAIAALAVIGTLTVSTIIAVVVYFIWFYDDPFATDISRSEAREAVALELCPQDPTRIASELIPEFDSGYWIVYIRASDDIQSSAQIQGRDDFVAVFLVTGGNELQVSSADDQSEAYMAYVRAACSAIPTPES